MKSLYKEEFDESVLNQFCDIMTLTDGRSRHETPKVVVSSAFVDDKFLASIRRSQHELKSYSPEERKEVFYLFEKNGVDVPRSTIYSIDFGYKEIVLIP